MGELRGVRDTVQKLIAQEMRGRPSSDRPAVEKQVLSVARKYDTAVREGREPLPKK